MIRHFETEDRDAVIALWSEVFPNEPAHNEPQAYIDRKLSVDDLFFVAIEDGTLVGTAIAGWDGVRGWLYKVAVAPHRQRQGIGKALVDHMLATLAARGCTKVNLQVRASNRAVIAFYEELGFHDDEVLGMGRHLSPDEHEVAPSGAI